MRDAEASALLLQFIWNGSFNGESREAEFCVVRRHPIHTYDIIYHAPKYADEGKTVLPGSFTVLHNGVLVQDQSPVKGDATTAAKFKGVTPKGPLLLQDHGNPVRYRNIWIRRLN